MTVLFGVDSSINCQIELRCISLSCLSTSVFFEYGNFFILVTNLYYLNLILKNFEQPPAYLDIK